MNNVYVAGCFDILNIGHVRLFEYAHKILHADCIIAGVSTDELIMSYKHKPPIMSLEERIEIISNLRLVDKVIIQSNFFNVAQLSKCHVTHVLLGSDWQNKPFPELERAQRVLEFDIVYKPYTITTSSSQIKKKIADSFYT